MSVNNIYTWLDEHFNWDSLAENQFYKVSKFAHFQLLFCFFLCLLFFVCFLGGAGGGGGMFLCVVATKGAQFNQYNWRRTLHSQVSVYNIEGLFWLQREFWNCPIKVAVIHGMCWPSLQRWSVVALSWWWTCLVAISQVSGQVWVRG